METPLAVVSGFGAFEAVSRNPSGTVARALEADPPRGTRVRGVELPVSFERGPTRLDAFVAAIAPVVPDLLVGLGVHKQGGFRVELGARASLDRPTRVDVDGVVAANARMSRDAQDLRSGLEPELRAFVGAREGWMLSEDAGGYVCERVFHRALEIGGQLSRPAVFIHLPPEALTPVDEQIVEVRRFVGELLARNPGGVGR